MTNITLGQTIAGTLSSSSPFQQYSSYSTFNPSPFKRYFNQYDLADVTSFDTIKVTLSSDSVPLSGTHLSIYDLTTLNILANIDLSISGSPTAINKPVNLYQTTYPGIKYGIQISEDVLDGSSSVPSGSYSLSLIDKGQTTSLLSANTFRLLSIENDRYPQQVIGVNAAGFYGTLATGTTALDDIALSSSGLFYGIKSSSTTVSADQLWVVDPSLPEGSQIGGGANLKDAAGNVLFKRLNALAFSNDNQLYAIGRNVAEVSEFYRIDVNTKVATLIATLPAGLNTAAPSGNTGDLVYDAANNRFLVASVDATSSSNALWEIPLANPAGANKIGNIGFIRLVGLSFENGQLTGFIGDNTYGPEGKVIINTSTGVGTLDPTFPTTNYAIFTGATSIFRSTRNDFNADRKADILWRNNDGRVALWTMNGSTVTTGSTFATVGTDWKISSTGDFNGDYKSDILWRNDDGQVALWTMDGATKTSGTVIATVGNDWKIAGTADFGGDRKADILWRNDNGQMAIWQMDGATKGASAVVANVSTDWKIAGTGDFGGDGKSDILWRNNDGRVALWQMDGLNVSSQNFLNPYPTVDNSWKIAGTGDFNGDSKADILWRNDDGSVNIWLMNGANVLSFGLVSAPYSVIDNSWKISGTGDFNGDGKSDILWRNTNGSTNVWEMNGLNVLANNSTNPYPVTDNTWTIATPIL